MTFRMWLLIPVISLAICSCNGGISKQEVDLARDADAYDASFRGHDKYMSQDYYGAIAEFTEAIRLNPNSASSYNARGWDKYMLGDKQGSREDLNQAAILYKQQGNTVEYEKLRKELTNRFNASP